MMRILTAALVLCASLFGQDNLTRRSSQAPKPFFYFGGLVNVAWNSDIGDPTQQWHTTGTSPLTSNSGYRGVVTAQYGRGLIVQLAYPWDTERTQGVFTYASTDEVADYVYARGYHAHGHVVNWGVNNADTLAAAPWWYSLSTSAAVDAATLNHSTNVLGHFTSKYPGYVRFWDVANEMLSDTTPSQIATAGYIDYDSGRSTDVLTFAPGLSHTGSGASYSPVGLWALFNNCHATVEPGVLCGYSDYGMEFQAPTEKKAAQTVNLIKTAQRDSAVIDYIGLQAHRAYDDVYTTTTTNGIRTINELNTLCNTFGALGVKCAITELDVTVPSSPSGGQLAQQSVVWADIVRTCYWNQYCVFITHWGMSDKDSWLGASAQATLFDTSYTAKSVFSTVLGALPVPRIFPMPGGVVR